MVNRVYTLSMSIFAQPTEAPIAKTKDAKRVAIFYAGILLIMVVGQLFTFEEFTLLITSFNLPGGVRFAHFITAFLVVAEVFALPFLLRMPLSRAFRWVSMTLGILVALIWIFLSVWIVTMAKDAANIGFLGTVVDIMPGLWAVFISAALLVLATWASWGLWPLNRGAVRVKNT